MKTIKFVKSDDPKTVLGSIKETRMGLLFSGAGEQVFRSIKRVYGADPPKDSAIFNVLAKGWSNGPVMVVVEGD